MENISTFIVLDSNAETGKTTFNVVNKSTLIGFGITTWTVRTTGNVVNKSTLIVLDSNAGG